MGLGPFGHRTRPVAEEGDQVLELGLELGGPGHMCLFPVALAD